VLVRRVGPSSVRASAAAAHRSRCSPPALHDHRRSPPVFVQRSPLR
jgi:hypothetical protein